MRIVALYSVGRGENGGVYRIAKRMRTSCCSRAGGLENHGIHRPLRSTFMYRLLSSSELGLARYSPGVF